jgi:IclR family pca regulon transcriptional regulator
MNTATSVKSATRVLDLLEMLASSPMPMGVSEVARRMEIPKSSAHMLLSTLEQRQYVICDEARRFALHPMFSACAGSWVGGFRATLMHVARKSMARLAQVTGETSFLAVPREDGTTLYYIDKVLSPQEVRCDAELYAPRALHSNSLGLVLLAFQPQARTEAFLRDAELVRFTPKTICDPEELRRELESVRARGYATTKDANTIGAAGASAPIFDLKGDVVAALNVSAPTARFAAILRHATTELVREAETITRELAMMAGRTSTAAGAA